MDTIKLCIVFTLAVGAHMAQGQSTGTSQCTYVFNVPQHYQDNCPGNPVANQDEDGPTKAQMMALISNQQEQLALLTMTVTELKESLDKKESVINNQEQNITAILAGRESIINNQQEQLALLTRDLNEVRDTLRTLQNTPNNQGQGISGDTGVNYIRWGRTVCPNNASKLYHGYAAKSYFSHTGGGVNYICLHNDPQWPDGVQGGFQSNGQIHGVEYKTIQVLDPGLLNNDAPCVACVVIGRSQQIMIPGRSQCDEGWTLEYSGVLVAQAYTQTKSTYECLDGNPEARDGGGSDKNGGLFYAVEANCGYSLPCPPYQQGYEISCVVCTK